jgi:hypothetical protein
MNGKNIKYLPGSNDGNGEGEIETKLLCLKNDFTLLRWSIAMETFHREML